MLFSLLSVFIPHFFLFLDSHNRGLVFMLGLWYSVGSGFVCVFFMYVVCVWYLGIFGFVVFLKKVLTGV